MLREQTLNDLRQERKTIQSKLADVAYLQQRLAAIELLLQPDDDASSCENGLEAVHARESLPAVGTFRDSVRRVLIEAHGPLTTDRIVSALQSKGITSSGKTPLKTLVTTELWRAEKKKEGIKRVGRGSYGFIPDKKVSA